MTVQYSNIITTPKNVIDGARVSGWGSVNCVLKTGYARLAIKTAPELSARFPFLSPFGATPSTRPPQKRAAQSDGTHRML